MDGPQKIIPDAPRTGNKIIDQTFDQIRRAFLSLYGVLDFETNKDSLTLDGDIYCNDLHVDPASIYLGKEKLTNDKGVLKFDGEEIGTGGTMRGVAVFVSETEPTEAEENDIWIKPA